MAQAFSPIDYATRTSAYGTPPDFFGRNVAMLDHTGHPLTSAYMDQWNQTVDDPYEMNLNRPNAADAPYTDAELEGLLREWDIDSAILPQRVARLAPAALLNSSQAHELRRLLTTRSFDIPAANVQIPARIRMRDYPQLHPSTHTVEMMAARLLSNMPGKGDPEQRRRAVERQLRIMLPLEILRGQKMDVNRLWGNGLDDNGNMVVDEGEGDAGAGEEFHGAGSIPLWASTPWQVSPVCYSDTEGSPASLRIERGDRCTRDICTA